jgi:hypothetical protein
MSKARDTTLTIALCLSLITHGAISLGLIEQYARSTARLRLPGYPRIPVAPAPDSPDTIFGQSDGTCLL